MAVRKRLRPTAPYRGGVVLVDYTLRFHPLLKTTGRPLEAGAIGAHSGPEIEGEERDEASEPTAPSWTFKALDRHRAGNGVQANRISRFLFEGPFHICGPRHEEFR